MTSMKYSVYAASLMAEGGGEVGDKQYRAWRGGGTASIMESWSVMLVENYHMK